MGQCKPFDDERVLLRSSVLIFRSPRLNFETIFHFDFDGASAGEEKNKKKVEWEK